ncbi:hypothetical protein EJB05_11960, partial [Eragrostis curvula]
MGGRRARASRRRRRRRRNHGTDRISGLPDELLHEILFRLPSTADAARTSLLSRRWRGVWAHVPAISLTDGDQAPGASILDAVDAAVAANAAPALDRLAISLEDDWYSQRRGEPDLAARIAPWLRFASRRLAGELSLQLFQPRRPGKIDINSVPQTTVKVPVCDRATAIDVNVVHLGIKLKFRASGGGTFLALRVLKITGSFRLHERSLERAVSSQCPRLQELTLCNNHDTCRKLTIRSDSLERLNLGLRVRVITVQTPRLVRLKMASLFDLDRLQSRRAHIAAPNLTEMTWYNTYDPQHNRIVDAPRHLQRLKVRLYCLRSALPVAALFERFDTVDELDLRVRIPRLFGVLPSFMRHQEGKFECKAFMKETAKLPQCKVLKLSIYPEGLQEYSIVVLHLLRGCANARKVVLYLDLHGEKVSDYYSSLVMKKEQGRSACGNRLTTDGPVLDSLEELELNFYRLGDPEVDLVNQLLLSCGAALKTVVIRPLWGFTSKLSSAKLETVAGFCGPETTIEFHGCRLIGR